MRLWRRWRCNLKHGGSYGVQALTSFDQTVAGTTFLRAWCLTCERELSFSEYKAREDPHRSCKREREWYGIRCAFVGAWLMGIWLLLFHWWPR